MVGSFDEATDEEDLDGAGVTLVRVCEVLEGASSWRRRMAVDGGAAVVVSIQKKSARPAIRCSCSRMVIQI